MKSNPRSPPLLYIVFKCNMTIHRGNSDQHPRGTCALLVAGACAPPVEVLPLSLLLIRQSPPPFPRTAPPHVCGWFCVLSPPVRVMVLALTFQSERMPRGVSKPMATAFEASIYKPCTCTVHHCDNLIHNAKTQLPHTLMHHRLSISHPQPLSHTQCSNKPKLAPHNPQARLQQSE